MDQADMSQTLSAETQRVDPLMYVNEMMVQLVREQRELSQRRADVRYPLGVEVTLAVRRADGTGLGGLCKAWAVDLSYQGIGLLVETDLLAGRSIFVQMPHASGSPVSLPGTVVFCRQILPQTYRSGVRFDF